MVAGTTVADLLTTAIRHHRAGDYAEAAALYRRIIAHEGSNVSALYLLGDAERHLGNPLAALEWCAAALALAPDQAVIRQVLAAAVMDAHNEGVRHFWSGEVLQALRIMGRILKADPGHEPTRAAVDKMVPTAISQATEAIGQGMADRAAALCQARLEPCPGHEGARRFLQTLPPAPAASSADNRRLDQIHDRLVAISVQIRDIVTALPKRNVSAGRMVVDTLLAQSAYADPRRLERFGAKYFSQSDEDGILQEIFRRVGATNRTFFEFGVENGQECNTLLLLHQGWRGAWLEGSAAHVRSIQARFADALADGSLRVVHQMIDRDNINDIIVSLALPEDLDLLSIDIDTNDYYVFEAIQVIRPRVVVIEYNAKFPPPTTAVVRYDANRPYDATDYMGASLESLTRLAERKGYRLVGCNITGVNAFFVRSDIAGDRFAEPATAEHLFHPPRYYLIEDYYEHCGGHPTSYGPYERF